MAAQVAAAQTDEPLALATALVAFANAQGGRDNITAAVAGSGRPRRRPPVHRDPVHHHRAQCTLGPDSRRRLMAEFTATVYQNEFSPDGGPTSTRSSP